jgi:hypothetical protein
MASWASWLGDGFEDWLRLAQIGSDCTLFEVPLVIDTYEFNGVPAMIKKNHTFDWKGPAEN